MCRYEFCWICLGEYPGYRHSNYDNGAVCGQRQMVLALFYVIWGIIIFMKLMQQIQLFTDSVTEFLFTPETALIKKQALEPKMQLLPLLVFIVKAIQCLFILVSGFANAQTINAGLNYYKRLTANNPHLNLQQKLYYMQ